MHLVLTTVVVLFLTSCASSEEHLVPKHGIRKRDLSPTDAEMILKLLLSKLEHGVEEKELLHKKFDSDKEHYLHGSEIIDKAGIKEVMEKAEPLERKYMSEKHPSLERDGFEMKKEATVSNKDIMDIMKKMKDLTARKSMEDAYKKEVYYGTSEKANSEENVYLSKDAAMKGTTGIMSKYEMYPDKVSDKDVSLAESLYHMSIAGDVETYPDIKMASLTETYGKKIADDTLHTEESYPLHKVNSEESFMKKVDDIGKTLLKEETYPNIEEDKMDEYLKKVAEEEKTLYYDEKVAYPEKALSLEKTAEEKALEEWKNSHKDVFTAETGAVFKLEGGYGTEGYISHEMNDDLMKKLKSFGIDKEMASELLHLYEESQHIEGDITHEIGDEFIKKIKSFGIDKEKGSEILHLFKESQNAEGIAHEMSNEFIKKLKSFGLDKEMGSELLHLFQESYYAEGSIDHEMSDEFMKKLKSFGIDKEMGSELLHLFKESHHVEEAIAHEISDELIKKLKSLGVDKEMSSEFLHFLKELHLADGSIAPEMNEELMKKIKSLGFDKEVGAELLQISKKLQHAEGGIVTEMSDELIKKLKTLGLDKKMGNEHDELLHLSKDFYNANGGIAHEMGDEMVKKAKTLGLDKEIAMKQGENLHLSKEFRKEKDISEGSIAYEKGVEQAHKDAHFHLNEEEIKKHIEDSLKFGAKDGIGFVEKGLTAEKAHGAVTKMGAGVEKGLHEMYGEESVKSKDTYGLGEAFAFEKSKGMYGDKVAFDDEIKLSKAHDIPFSFEDEKMYKAHDDELMKKGMTYGTDTLFHKDEEFLKASSDHHIPHLIKDEEAVVIHDKHHSGGAEKGHTVFHDLKTKFFELLTRVLRTRKCHLVTMRPSELLSIVNCISKSKDPVLCEKFSFCEKKMPFRVLKAKEKCQQETIPGGMKRCTRYAPLFSTPEIPVKLFQCVSLNVRELMAEEKKQMIDFEECARSLKAESCARFKLFHGSH